MSRKIFVSYSRRDVEVVEGLVADLEGAGFDVWRDRELSGGQAWWDALLDEIRATDVFLAAISEESLTSIACRREREYASQLGKPILPVLISSDASPKLAPPELARTQWVDYRGQDKSAAFAIMRALQGLEPAPALPEKLPTPPEAPVSYLTELADIIDRADPLAEQEQLSLVFKLRDGLKDPEDRDESLELLRRMRGRDELLARASDEIDRLLEEASPRPVVKARPPQAAAQPVQAARPTPAVQEPAKSRIGIWVVGGVAAVAVIAAVAVNAINSGDDRGGSPGTTAASNATQPGGDSFQAELDAALSGQLGQAGIESDLGCFEEVSEYAIANGLVFDTDGTFIWYLDPFNSSLLREDGLAYLAAIDRYQSFCTGRLFNVFTGQWEG